MTEIQTIEGGWKNVYSLEESTLKKKKKFFRNKKCPSNMSYTPAF